MSHHPDLSSSASDVVKGCPRRDFLKGIAAGGVCAASWSSAFAAAMSGGELPKTLILSGSAFALGVAIAHPDRCVIIERGLHLAPEFSQIGDRGILGEAVSTHGKNLARAIAAAGLVSGGRLELPPLSDFLHAYAAEKGIPFFCNAELVSFQQSADGAAASVCGGGSAGLCDVTARTLLDTSPIGWKDCGIKDVESRVVSAITMSGMVSAILPPDATRRDARLRLHDKIASLPKGPRVLAEANELGTIYIKRDTGIISKEIEKGWRWIPSAQFGTFMSAFEEGVKCVLV